MPDAVIFDLDGLLLDSEQVWSAAKQRLVDEAGGQWLDEAEQAMLGMSSPEWARYMREKLGVPLDDEEISAQVVRIMQELYREELPLLPGADEALRRIAERWPVAIASSSNREIIDLVLERTGWSDLVRLSVASEEVERGKPSPDVYLAAARGLGAERCVGVEDSGPGIRSAHAAGFGVVAVPNPHFPPDEESLALADAVLDSLEELNPDVIERSES